MSVNYEEIKNSLRNCVNAPDCHGCVVRNSGTAACSCLLMLQGADAIEQLQRLCDKYGAEIERLKNERGEWETDSDNLPVCSKCGEIALQRVFVKVPHLIQDVRMVRSNFCPNCGADMRKEDDNE